MDYNSPVAPVEEIARSIRAIFSTGVTRFFPTVITGSPDDMLGALRNLARARETLAGRSRDGGVSRRGSAHFASRRAARGASGALDSPARHRGVPPLAGRRPGPRKIRHAVPGMARGDWLTSSSSRGKAWSPASATRGRRASRSRTRFAPERRFPPTSAMAPMPCCPVIPITSGSNWPRTSWRRASLSTGTICRIRSCASPCGPKASSGASW